MVNDWITKGIMLPILILFIVLNVLTTLIWQEKEINGKPIGNEKIVSLFVNEMIFYMDTPSQGIYKIIS